jgi:hypothetical protein
MSSTTGHEDFHKMSEELRDLIHPICHNCYDLHCLDGKRCELSEMVKEGRIK